MAYYKCGRVYTTQNSNVVVDTASGAVANFNTPLALPLVSANFGVNAKQDLHGYDHPWPAGGGKNISHFGTDNFDNSQQCTITYVDNNNLTINAIGNYARVMYAIMCPENTTVTVSFKGSSTANYRKVQISSVNSWSGVSWYKVFNLTEQETTFSSTFTTSADSTTIYIGFYVTAGASTGSMFINDFQIEKGSSATSFEPYENICPIEGWSKINPVHTGKNQIKNIIAQGQSANYVYIGQSNMNTHETHLKSGAYTISYKTRGSTLPSIYIKKQGVAGNIKLANYDTKATFTVEDGDYRFWLYRSDGVNYEDIYEPQIELGSEVTDYELYNGNEYIINLGGTYYGGHLTQDKAGHRQFEVTHEITDLGDISYSYNSTYSLFIAYLPAAKRTASGKGLYCLCTCFSSNYDIVWSGWANFPNYSVSCGCNYDTSINLVIKDTDYIDATAFKNAMSGVKLVYELATPYVIDLPDGTPIKSFPGVNNIFCDTGDASLQFRKIG